MFVGTGDGSGNVPCYVGGAYFIFLRWTHCASSGICGEFSRVEEQSVVVPQVRLGVDIGGTFTDLLLVNEQTGEVVIGKTLTTPDDPSLAVEQETAAALARAEVPAGAVRSVVHGTTLVTNAIIERKGDLTALVTTRGYRDALEIGREHRYDMYDVTLELPRPLVPRHLRLGITERVLSDGSVRRPLDEAGVERLARELARKGIKAVAVSLLHSYRNPEHEQRVGEIFAQVAPDIRVSLSSDVVPEMKEYERTSTTVCNAYVKRLVDRYLADLERRLTALGVGGRLHVMLSSGGVGVVATGRRYPVRLLESGPAAGALASAHIGRGAGYRDLLSFDMGGTTAKLCIIQDGRPLTTSQLEVARVYRFKKGSGLPVRIPVIDMIEVGAGGGSIAHLDSLGLMKVGPESAGADPGPACYGRGGTEPTVTDADLVLGYLDPRFFLGGRMALDVDAARTAIKTRIADPLGLSMTDAAWGIHRIVNENMANAARIHAVERGKDPRAFPLFAFGGAGPVHACALASLVGNFAVIVPLGAGVGSTIGLLAAPLAFDFVRTSLEDLTAANWTRVNAIVADMEREGRALLHEAGVESAQIETRRSVEMRYLGQGHEVEVPLPDGELGPASVDRIFDGFNRVYRRLFGRVAERVGVEAVNWRVTVSGPDPALDLRRRVSAAGADATQAIKTTRPVYFGEVGDYRSTVVYDRYRLGPGTTFEGPAVVEERESTVVVGPGARVSVDESMNLLVRNHDAR